MSSERVRLDGKQIKEQLTSLRPPDGLTAAEVLVWSHAHGVFYACWKWFDGGGGRQSMKYAVIQYSRPEINVLNADSTYVVDKEIIQFGPTSIVPVDLDTAQALADALNDKLGAIARQRWVETMDGVHKRVVDQLRGILVAQEKAGNE